MSALLVSEVSTRRDYWRNTAVTLTKIQSSWRRIFVDRSYHMGPFLVGWSANKKLRIDNFRLARDPPRIGGKRQRALQLRIIEFSGPLAVHFNRAQKLIAVQ